MIPLMSDDEASQPNPSDDAAAKAAWSSALLDGMKRHGIRSMRELQEKSGVGYNTVRRHVSGERLPQQGTLRQYRRAIPDLVVPVEVHQVEMRVQGISDTDGDPGATVLEMFASLPLSAEEKLEVATRILDELRRELRKVTPRE